MTSYDSLVEEFGHEIVLQEMIGDYHGDYLFLLHSHDAYGFLVQGYGSCSACDVLESIELSQEYERDIKALKESMYQSIVWYPAGEMISYLQNGAEGFFLHEREWEKFVENAISEIMNRENI